MDEASFQIQVTRTGGFAALRREWAVTITPPEELDVWTPLIEACPWDESYGPGLPDGYVYAFAAADRSAVVPENQLCDAWRQLRDEVLRRAEAE